MPNTINNWNTYCGCGSKSNSCSTVFQKVDELPTLGDATRDNAYILPDDTVWVVNADGTGFSQLNGGTGAGGAYDDTEIKERIQALEFRPDLDTVYTAGTGISISTDNVISATGGGNSYDDTELRTKVEGVSTLLDSKLTLKADNMPAQEAGLGDIYEVDFTNLVTKIENNKLTISNPIGKVASRVFTSDEHLVDGVVLILERISKELFRATVEITATQGQPLVFGKNIDDLLLQIIPEGVSEIDDMFLEGSPLDFVLDTDNSDNVYIQSVKASGGTGNNLLEVQFTSKLGRFTYSAIFKTGVE